MAYNNDIRDEELDKLKKSNHFDDETLNEIRNDLDKISKVEIARNKEKIKEGTEKIVRTIPKEKFYNYYKLAF